MLYKHPNTCRNPEDWGVWTDEYLTIYPDGVGVRLVDTHDGPKTFITQLKVVKLVSTTRNFPQRPAQNLEDNINLQSLTIVSSENKITELDWSESHPGGYI